MSVQNTRPGHGVHTRPFARGPLSSSVQKVAGADCTLDMERAQRHTDTSSLARVGRVEEMAQVTLGPRAKGPWRGGTGQRIGDPERARSDHDVPGRVGKDGHHGVVVGVVGARTVRAPAGRGHGIRGVVSASAIPSEPPG